MSSSARATVEIATLRIKVTGADVDYVGSVTIDSALCDYLGFRDRQLLQIRNETTGVDLWTYVIYGRRSCSVPEGTLCLNGAAAHLVDVGDVVVLTAWANLPLGGNFPVVRSWDAVQDGLNPQGHPSDSWASKASVEMAIGKVHRPRISQVIRQGGKNSGPSVALDADWVAEAGLFVGQSVHVVNTTTGQRDVLPLRIAGERECIITMANPGVHSTAGYGSRPGYHKGDIIIVMAYAEVQYVALSAGSVPTMRIAFPEEKANPPENSVKRTNKSCSEKDLSNESAFAARLIEVLDLKRPDLRILDCSCGNVFPGTYLLKAGINLQMSDSSETACQRTRDRLAEGNCSGVDVRCVRWGNLVDEYGPEAFDVLFWRASSLPYKTNDWSALPCDDNSTGYHQLQTAIESLFDVLAPNGKLYVDCVPPSFAGDDRIRADKKAKTQLEWDMEVDADQRAKTWCSLTTPMKENGDLCRTMNANLTALLVREQEVRSILANTGFRLTESRIRPGNETYQPFIATKVDGEIKRTLASRPSSIC